MLPDITQALKDTENALRDFIAVILEKTLGKDWIDSCGVSSDRVEKWRQRKADESKRQESGVVEERLLYYADFYDISTILKKHWDKFAPALGDWKTMDVYLGELEKLRDPDAHRRELMPHQKHLAAGIAGDIRSRIIRHRSQQETTDAYFPRIESARDSLGNMWTPSHMVAALRWLDTGMTLHPGDLVEYVVTASDPMGGELEYKLRQPFFGLGNPWQKENSFSVRVREEDIGERFNVVIAVRSSRPHHAKGNEDDHVTFDYAVLPLRSATGSR
ncbi:MAG: Swt1 family HEPN domain-containing protein [Verrucomicrobiia bacterium]|jgi:hypothetical protein